MKTASHSPAQEAASKNLPRVMAALAALGLAVSSYLTAVHYSSVPLVCLGTTGCEEVNRSLYSEVAGVSVALLGGAAYLVILLVMWAESQAILKPPEAALGAFGLALAGALYSGYLTYVELFVLRAVCSWCVISALAVTGLLALSIVRLRRLLAADMLAGASSPPARSCRR